MHRITARIGAYARLLRLHRPIGTVLLLWPALWALWAAAVGVPPLWVLTVFCLGALFMRSAGCALNDYMDRDIDGLVERTRTRPLPAGELQPQEALLAFAVPSILAFMLVLSLGAKLVLMAVAGLVLVVLYPLAKRFIPIPQIVLGVAFSWSTPMAYVAVTGEVPHAAWLLFAASVAWVVAYDTIYALADREDDMHAGIYSSAITFGNHAREISLGLHMLSIALLAVFGTITQLHPVWYLCLAVAGAIAVWQWYLTAEISIDRCIRAFGLNGWLGLAPFTGLVLDSLWR